MNNLTTVLLVILAVLVVLLVVLYFLGNRMQKRQAEQQELLDAAKQTVSILVIDKKRLPLKESGLPKQVIEQTPWYAKRSKLPIVKAKVGPRVMTLIAQDTAFEQLPVKTEARVVVSGLYITEVKSVRGGIPPVPRKKKKSSEAFASELFFCPPFCPAPQHTGVTPRPGLPPGPAWSGPLSPPGNPTSSLNSSPGCTESPPGRCPLLPGPPYRRWRSSG